MTKIPTELYICVPRRSSRGAFHTNIWANLTRKDTREGMGAKKLLSFLDDVKVSLQYTQEKTGYAGPFDINPKTTGSHKTYIAFEGDAQFEPCKSEEIPLRVDPNLLRTEITMEATPLSGYAPLTILLTGAAYEIRPDGSKTTPAYSLPLDLMVFDSTSTKRLRPVGRFETNTDGTCIIGYTFTKTGTYAIFVNFLGDVKYCSAWSNNGRTTTITVTGGELPLSFDKSISIEKSATITANISIKWIKSDTEPTAPEGYVRYSALDLDFGVLGKCFAFIKIA